MRLHIFFASLRYCLFRFLPLALLLFTGAAQSAGFGSFIVGGQVVGTSVKYPFMASIQLDRFGNGEYRHTCGGTLIADRWIVTAAHCVHNSDFGWVYRPRSIGIVLGTSNLASRDGTFILAEQIIAHPDYSTRGVRNDIALIKLSSNYPSTVAVLPAAGSLVPVIEETSIVAGWGSTTETGGGSNQLREVALPIISNASCFPFYPRLFDARLAQCAGGSRAGGQDSCKGDSGGPQLVSRNNVYVLAGIISFGEGCARRGVPGVYTRVEVYTDWITSITEGTLEYGDGLTSPPVDDTAITRLDVNSTTAGSILSGQAVYYDVSGAKQVNLTSNFGDADLYVLNDADFQAISPDVLKCVSENASRLDVCAVNESPEGAYAVVFGFEDTRYTISTQSIASNSNSVQTFNQSSDFSSGGLTAGSLSVWFLLSFAFFPGLRWMSRS